MRLGPNDVLVKIEACSLNARDNQIANNTYGTGSKPPVVPLSDCAGKVIATSKTANRFDVGARVCATFHRDWIAGPLRYTRVSSVGAKTIGVLRQYAVFHEDELVAVPTNFTPEEAATLPCAAVTAWNALFCGGRSLKPGDIVLTQGSGGVSLFAIQFARLAGAIVIATTGQLGGDREKKLRELGANEVINYKDANWGEQAKAITPGKRGVDFIVEVSGAAEQSTKALALGGTISAIGGFAGHGASLFNMRTTMGELRRIVVGSRSDFEDMNKAIEANGIKPVVDPTVFRFTQAREAYEYAESGKMCGKVVIRTA